MDIAEIILIIFVNLIAFLLGLTAGRLYRHKKDEQKRGGLSSLRRDADWHLLANYYPDEPTDILS